MVSTQSDALVFPCWLWERHRLKNEQCSESRKPFNSSYCLAQPLSSSPVDHAQQLQKQQTHESVALCICREGGKEHVHQHREVIQRFPCCKFYSLDHFRSNFYSLLHEWSCLLHVLEIDKNCRIIAANWTNGSSSVSLFTSANMNCQVPLKERDTESNITNEPKRLLNVWKHLVHDATLSNLLNRSSGNIIWFVRYHLKNGIAVTAEGHEESLRVLAHHILSGSMGSIQEEEKFFLFCCSVFCQNAPWPTSS